MQLHTYVCAKIDKYLIFDIDLNAFLLKIYFGFYEFNLNFAFYEFNLNFMKMLYC